MGTSAGKLVNVLSEKEALIRELLKTLEEEQGGIAEMDLARMEMADEKKRELLVRLEDSNNEFRQILRQMAGELNLPEGANLSCLLGKMSSPERSALQGLQARLLELGATLDKVLQFNRDLLQGSMKMVDRSLQFFQGLFKRSTTYGYGGGMVASPTDVRLVCKEI